MTSDEKLTLINRFKYLSDAFDDVLKLSNDLISYRPFKDAWSIKEQIVHCLEVDIANFHRYRRAIAQPETQILSFDQIWTSKLNYQSSDLQLTIELMKMVRKYMASHLKTIIDEDWTKFASIHDKKGRLDLEEALKAYIDHIDFHRKLVDRNIEMYNNKNN